MSGILDQRALTGVRTHSTVDDVRSEWSAYARREGFVDPQTGRRRFELRRDDTIVPAYISAGRYVADCPYAACNGGAAAWRENPDACCLDCGTVFEVSWPDQEELTAAVDVLLERELPATRNWRVLDPEESVDDLKAQNLLVGDPIPLRVDAEPDS